MPRYEKLCDPLALEASVLKFWEQAIIPQKSLQQNEKNRSQKRFVFYEGPPTANDRPHYGHLIPRVYKDLFPRYKLMQGYHVVKKGGWDTHGLPVELKVEKELGLNSKREIEAFGLESFAKKCRENVWRFKGEWEKFDPRMGFWYDQEHAYITYTDEYIESVWWALKRIWEKGLLYKGHKVLPYCPRCGTPLSSHEVAQGYETVKDPSIFVKFKVTATEPNTYFLAWTTTPWTVPSNVALAVGAKFAYAKVKLGSETLILAQDLVKRVIKEPHEVVGTLQGAELVGWRYEPAYKLSEDLRAYRICTADFVSLEDGTGIVHTAPAFGEEDYQLGQQEHLPFVNPVDLEGKFTKDFSLAQGQFVKDTDLAIMQDLKQRGLLYKSGKYEHEYPFCWRCKTPLLYYALDSYFIKTTAKQKEISENNQNIHWHPEHFRDGRFGNFLETMKDWALSRDRYWGTPLPIWVCEKCQKEHCVGSRQELTEMALDRERAQHVEFHRPWVDDLSLQCACGGMMRRVPYVIDCWFDSGMMHTAQWHYPFENQKEFEEQFPADFICEGIDQTRGWFYSLLVTSTLLYEKPYPHPYKHVIVTGMGLDEKGKKMSKSLGNVLSPWEVVNVYGADAVRWFFYSGSAPWRDRKLDPKDVAEARGVLETVRNVYNFFALYAGIDKFDPAQHTLDVSKRALLDRWILSRLQSTVQATTEALDDYDVVAATQAISGFVDALSNWYVRNSRARFWGNEWTADKTSAFATLYEVLLDLAKLLAPFVPFLAEAIYQNLKTDQMPQSVHLCAWPQVNKELRDTDLEADMKCVREIVTAGLQARNKANIKVRQPLRRAVFYLRRGSPSEEKRIIGTYGELIRSELNVKEIEAENLVDNLYKYGRQALTLSKFKLGPKFRELLPKIEQAVDHLRQSGTIVREDELLLDVDGQAIKLVQGEFGISFHPNEVSMDGQEGDTTVILNTHIDDALRQEGLVREFVRLVQDCRKEAGFEVSDRIELFYEADPDVRAAIEKFSKHVQEETLAVVLQSNGASSKTEFSKELDVNGRRAKVGLARKK